MGKIEFSGNITYRRVNNLSKKIDKYIKTDKKLFLELTGLEGDRMLLIGLILSAKKTAKEYVKNISLSINDEILEKIITENDLERIINE